MAAKPLLNLLDLDRAGLERQFSDWGEKAYRATQLMKWIYQRQVTDFELMSDLSRALRARLAAETEIRLPELMFEQSAEDGTRKWLLHVDSGNSVEMVLIPDAGRHTLCISSQVGCALDCTFCATARQGFNRNLSTAEIAGQLWLATRLAAPVRISNVVFMGMGEPLTNFDNVVGALSLFQDDFAWGLSKRRVTVSTSGVVPALRRLGQVTDVSLAVSLHAPTDELRDKLVPLNRKYPIAQLLDACAEYLHGQNGKRRITWEYVMIDGLNDRDEHARALARLICHIPSKVNLIPFNPFPGTQFRRSSEQRLNAFRDILLERDLVTITRRTRGHEIAAACGQLAGRVQDRSRRHLKLPLVQVET